MPSGQEVVEISRRYKSGERGMKNRNMWFPIWRRIRSFSPRGKAAGNALRWIAEKESRMDGRWLKKARWKCVASNRVGCEAAKSASMKERLEGRRIRREQWRERSRRGEREEGWGEEGRKMQDSCAGSPLLAYTMHSALVTAAVPLFLFPFFFTLRFSRTYMPWDSLPRIHWVSIQVANTLIIVSLIFLIVIYMSYE